MRNILVAGIAILASIIVTSCGGGGDPVVPAPVWTSPVHHYTAEVFPSDYIVGKEYQVVIMSSVGDAVNAGADEFVVGLYTAEGALYPYGSNLHMVSVGDLYVNEQGKFMATQPGPKTLKVQVWDSQGHLYVTVQFSTYFRDGVLWDSPVGRFHIEAQPSQYIIGHFYDMELIHNMGDLVTRQPNQVMIGLYRSSDEGALFSETIGLKFVPSGASLFINEFGKFSADSAGQKTVIAEVVDSQGHLYITVVFHPWFVVSGGNPPPPPPPVNYSLRVFGASGEFTEGGTVQVNEGNGYSLPNWELWGSDSSKIQLGSANIQFSSSVLPFWVWDPIHGEINTALWACPENPNVNDPGNIFVNPGSYDIHFSITCAGRNYTRSGALHVLDRPDFP